LNFAFARQLFIVMILGLVTVGYVQVSSAPSQRAARASFEWDSVVSDSATQLRDYVAGIRGEVTWWMATYDRVAQDTRELQRRLSVENVQNAGE
jgi:hypothetical protein